MSRAWRGSRLRRFLPVVLCLGGCSAACAHSMYQAALLLDYHEQSVDAELQLPASRLAKVFGHPLAEDGFSIFEKELDRYIAARVRVRTPAHAPWAIRVDGPLRWEFIDGAPYIIAHLSLAPPSGTSARTLVLEDDVITDALPSQVVLVSVRSDWANSTFANEPNLVGVIDGADRTLQIDRGAGSWMRGFGSVFHLGVRHIAEGTDHLLFLLALLLPAPLLYRDRRWAGFAGARQAFTRILAIVTAFTFGHSLTLALAASGIARVPGKPIEVLIAVSILVSAVHAARPLFPGREAYIAGGFGLIHGLAFASTLAELGLHRWERLASILAFNIGIEAMQLIVVLCVMPSLVLLSHTRVYTPFRLLSAGFAGAAALGWMLERISGRTLAVDRVVDGPARHSALLAALFFCCALFASRSQGRPTAATQERCG